MKLYLLHHHSTHTYFCFIPPFFHPFLHLFDLLGLGCDDICTELYELRLIRSCEVSCHLDGSLMVWDHPFEKCFIEFCTSLSIEHLAHVAHTHIHHIVSHAPSEICLTSCHLRHHLAVFCHLGMCVFFSISSHVHSLFHLLRVHASHIMLSITPLSIPTACSEVKCSYDHPYHDRDADHCPEPEVFVATNIFLTSICSFDMSFLGIHRG